MTIAINPTTTIPQLTANNTSAADSFPGWPNGLPKPSAVGLGPLPVPQKKRVLHRVNWWSTGPGRSTSHPDIGISSFDPIYAAKAVAYAQAEGFNVFSQLWHGPLNTNHKSAMAQMPELEKRGMEFFICIGSSAPTLKLPPSQYPTFTVAQRTAELKKLFDSIRANFFKSPAYLRRNTKPMLQFFGIEGVDWTAMLAYAQSFGADAPEFWFRIENDGKHHDRKEAAGFFGWRSCDPAWVAFAQQFGKPLMIGVNGSFDSSHEELPVRCTWGNEDKRDPMGGLRWVEQLALAAAHPEIEFLQACTADDYQEGSALEPGLASGKTLTLSIQNGVLTRNEAGDAFTPDLTWYVSKDGVNFAGLAWAWAPTFDLSKLDFAPGTYYFLVRAIGKPFVQNILSNVVSATLSWK